MLKQHFSFSPPQCEQTVLYSYFFVTDFSASGGGEKRLWACRRANSQAVIHRSVISGEICLSWKKSSLMRSHHLLNLDHCQTVKNRFPDSPHKFTLNDSVLTRQQQHCSLFLKAMSCHNVSYIKIIFHFIRNVRIASKINQETGWI